MPNIDSNFTHFLCIFVGHKCAKVKKIPKKSRLLLFRARAVCVSIYFLSARCTSRTECFLSYRKVIYFIALIQQGLSFKIKNTAFTVKDGVQITNGCSIY